jgi:hypothetical protein
MSVHRPDSLPQGTHPWDKHSQDSPDRSDRCFFCGEGFWAPRRVVAWFGYGYTLWLHPECAVNLMLRLMRDVHAVQCIEGTRAVFGGEGR